MNWELKKVNIKDLIEYKDNPRKLTEKGLKHLKNSIEKFGVAEPLVINTDFTICGGHGRKKILEEMNLKEVDCYIPERKLTEEEFKELNIRLNKNIAGDWDFEILEGFFNKEDLIDWGFEEEEFGINMNPDDFKDDFNLPDGDKSPFQQMTFTFANEQANLIKQAITDIKKTDAYKYCETFGNENSNGNALYYIISRMKNE